MIILINLLKNIKYILLLNNQAIYISDIAKQQLQIQKNQQKPVNWNWLIFIEFRTTAQQCLMANPLTPMSDQDRISPDNINTISISSEICLTSA